MSENPYEAPRSATATSTLTYYKTQSTKLNLREYRRLSKNWLEFVLAVCFKFLRIQLPMTCAFADTGQFQRVAPQELSDRVREKLKPLADQALALKLKYAFSYWIPTIGALEGAAAVFFSEDGRSNLLIANMWTWSSFADEEKTVFAFVSRLANGNVLGTSGTKGDLDPPPNVLGESHPGKTMQEVFERHLARLRDAGSPVVTVHDPDQLEQMLRQYERESFEYNIRRGIYVPITDNEFARMQQLAAATPGAPPRKAKPQFQGVELICWIAVVVPLFLFTGEQPKSMAQIGLRLGIIFTGLAGIAIIWLIRLMTWMQRKSEA